MCTLYCSDEYFLDHTSTDSDDLDTDDLTSLLTGWEDASSDPSLKTPVQPGSHQKLNSVSDTSGGVSAERCSEAPPSETPPGPPSLDIEADITVGEKIDVQSFLSILKLKKQFSGSVNILCSCFDV